MRKSKYKVLLLVFCLLSMLFQQQIAFAQGALAPVENYVVNRAVAGIIANRIGLARGFAANDAKWLATAANDPVFKATMDGVSKTMTGANVVSTALGVGLAVAGAPVWLSVAASLGVVAIGTWIAYNASKPTDYNLQLVDSSTGPKFQVTNKAIGLDGYSTPGAVGEYVPYAVKRAVAAGGRIYRDPTGCTQGMDCYLFPPVPDKYPMMWARVDKAAGYYLIADNIQDLAKYYAIMSIDFDPCPGGVCTFTLESVGTGWTYSDDGTAHWYVWVHESRIGGDPAVRPDYDRTYFVYPEGARFDTSVVPRLYKNLDDARAAVDTSLSKAPVAPALLAKIADKAWQNAASQPGYQGQPYDAAHPLTDVDAYTWTNANPSASPTLDDFTRPAQNVTTDPNGVPISLTVVATATDPGTGSGVGTNVNVINTPNVNVVNAVKVDLGTDPGIGSPTLESTPGASEILSPLLNLMPELRSFQLAGHAAGECPRPSFEAFGRKMVMETHCDLAEQYRPALAAVMAVVWLIVAIRIILSA